jgi:hypothetical protein
METTNLNSEIENKPVATARGSGTFVPRMTCDCGKLSSEKMGKSYSSLALLNAARARVCKIISQNIPFPVGGLS